MITYRLRGTVYPPRVGFTINKPIIQRIDHPDFNIRGEVKLRIINSSIYLYFYTENQIEDIATLRNVLDAAIRMVVDSFCYVKSYAYDIDIEAIECDELDLLHPFSVQGEFNINRTPLQSEQEFFKLMEFFTSPESTFLMNVIADFRQAIKYPYATASHCFRAIEIIRKSGFEDHSIQDDSRRRDKGWESLRNQLGYQIVDFDQIKLFAIPNRHGAFPTITFQEREAIMNFTRTLIDRYIDHELSKRTNRSES
jgi:hypothetical protein